MDYQKVVFHGFTELINLKKSYMSNTSPRRSLVDKYITTILTIISPIVPRFVGSLAKSLDMIIDKWPSINTANNNNDNMEYKIHIFNSITKRVNPMIDKFIKKNREAQQISIDIVCYSSFNEEQTQAIKNFHNNVETVIKDKKFHSTILFNTKLWEKWSDEYKNGYSPYEFIFFKKYLPETLIKSYPKIGTINIIEEKEVCQNHFPSNDKNIKVFIKESHDPYYH